MHPNPIYRKTDAKTALAFARARSFGVLSINGPERPLFAHIPFHIGASGAYAEAHLVRSNPLWRALEAPQPATLVISGPDGYISPDWYGIEDQVPTWNYIAVHLCGTLLRLDPSELPRVLDETSAHFEAQLAPKPEWTREKMSAETREGFERQIMPVRLEIEKIESSYKLGQNKSAEMRGRAADALGGASIGQDCAALAAAIRQTIDA